MLQQTQVDTVIPYFERFLKRFPTVKELAQAGQAEVLKYWEGLGYYRRARSLHEAAKQIVAEHGGKFPLELDSVLALPGIGRYTAGAILSIADGQRLPILEGNTIRLLARLDGNCSDTAKTTTLEQLWQFSESILPKRNCGDFNQALMELGSQICRPGEALCEKCPVAQYCSAFEMDKVDQIPVSSKRQKTIEIYESLLMVRRNGRYLVRECLEGQRWAGLFDFPRLQSQKSRSTNLKLARFLQQEASLTADFAAPALNLIHHVTKYKINLSVYAPTNVAGKLTVDSQYQWVTDRQLERLPLNVTARKVHNQFITNKV